MLSCVSDTDALLELLTPDEKAWLLRRLLRRGRQPHRTTSPQYGAGTSAGDAVPADVMDVQTGLLASFQNKKVPRSRPDDVEEINDKIMQYGLSVSKQEFRELCRWEDHQEQVQVRRTRHASLLPCQDSPLGQGHMDGEEESLKMEESSVVFEEQLVRKVKVQSLLFPSETRTAKERRLLKQAKLESLSTVGRGESQCAPPGTCKPPPESIR